MCVCSMVIFKYEIAPAKIEARKRTGRQLGSGRRHACGAEMETASPSSFPMLTTPDSFSGHGFSSRLHFN